MSRTGLLAWVSLVRPACSLLVARWPAWWRREPGRDACGATRLLGRRAGRWPLATWAAAGPVGWLVARCPAAGCCGTARARSALCAPLTRSLVGVGARGGSGAGCGAAVLRSWSARPCAVLPLALLPDAAWGVGGGCARSTTRRRTARRATRWRGRRPEADVLLLPFTSYRAPAWHDGRKVLDPLGRYLTPDYVASDDLVVSGRRVAGEDTRVHDVRGALAAPTPAERAPRRWPSSGSAYVVTSTGRAGPAPEVAGEVLLDRDELAWPRLSRRPIAIRADRLGRWRWRWPGSPALALLVAVSPCVLAPDARRRRRATSTETTTRGSLLRLPRDLGRGFRGNDHRTIASLVVGRRVGAVDGRRAWSRPDQRAGDSPANVNRAGRSPTAATELTDSLAAGRPARSRLLRVQAVDAPPPSAAARRARTTPGRAPR